MYRRALPRFADLKAFLTYLDDQGEVAEIRQSVDMNLELTEIHRRVIAEEGPVLRLRNPTVGGQFQGVEVVANLYGKRRRVLAAVGLECHGKGTDVAGLGEMLAFLRSPRPPKGLSEMKSLLPVARAALNSRPKVVRDTTGWVELGADLTRLPIQTCWPEDAGPLITWPMVITRPPGEDTFDGYNLGVYRMQVIAPDAAIMRWLPMRGGAGHHRQWMRDGKEMPVAVVIGADPATMMGAVMPAPEGVTELSLAGILAGERIGMVPCRDLPLHVPASSEIVIEGTISPGDVAPEGPFGDHTGYYNPPEMHAVFRIKSIRMREGGVYLTTFTGRAPDEPSVIGDVMADLFKPLLRQMLPEVIDLWLPPETCSYRVAVLAIDKRYAGQARRVMMGFWSLLPQFSMTKMVIVVDDDIDIRSWSDVMWAVATRSDPSRDVMIADRTPIDHLDFASPLEGLGGKIGIDATNKIGAETSRGWGRVMKMDAEVRAAVDRRWDSLFGKD